MKKIYHILLIMLAMSFGLIACTEETPFSTATENDDPRILDPLFPDRVNGELPVVSNISRDANFSMTLTVTPADYTTVTWFIDGEEIQTGKEIDLALKAGTYHLKVTATTSIGKSTYREGLIQVNPLADDPWATEIGFERIITTGAKAQLYGNNLDKVNSIVIGGKTATDVDALYFIEIVAIKLCFFSCGNDAFKGNFRSPGVVCQGIYLNKSFTVGRFTDVGCSSHFQVISSCFQCEVYFLSGLYFFSVDEPCNGCIIGWSNGKGHREIGIVTDV